MFNTVSGVLVDSRQIEQDSIAVILEDGRFVGHFSTPVF
jgi:hypothetical protein